MSAALIRCPKCQTALRTAAPLKPGCAIRCPSCQTAFKVGAPPPPPAPRAVKAAPPAPARKRPSDDSDPDLRPARRSRERETPGTSKILVVGLIASVVLVAVVIGVIAMSGDKKPDGKVALSPPPPPFLVPPGQVGPDGVPLPPGDPGRPPRPTRIEEEDDDPNAPALRPPVRPRDAQPNEEFGPPAAPAPLPDAKDRPYLSLDPGGHTAMVHGVLFTPDGKRLVTVSRDKTIRLIDVASGETLHIVHMPVGPADEGSLHAAALTPDGKKLAVSGFPVGRGSQGIPIYLLRLDTGQLERVLDGNEGLVSSLAFSPDGARLFSSNAEGVALLFDLRTGQSAPLPRHPDKVRSLACSPNGQLLVTGCEDRIVRLFNLATGALVAEMRGHGSGVNAVAFAPDGRSVASGCGINDGHIRLWNLDGTPKAAHPVRDHSRDDPLQLTSLCFSRDGKEILYTGISYAGQAGLVDVASGKHRITLKDHSNTVVAGHLSADGQLAVTSGGNDNEVFVWRTSDGAIVHRIVGKGKAVCATAWSRDGKTIAWGNTNRGDTTTGLMPLERTFRLATLDFGPAPDDTYLRKMNEAGGYTMEATDFYSITVKQHGQVVGVSKARSKGDRIYSFSPLPDGKRAIIGASSSLYMIDLKTGEVLRDFKGHTGIIFSVSPAPNGVHFLTGSTDQTMCLFHVDRAEPVVSLFMAGREWIAWTPEGYYAASAYGERLMGWLIGNGINKLAGYYPAIRFRASLFQPEAMKRLARAGSVQKALELVAKERNRPAQQPTYLGHVLPPQVKITTPEQGDLKQAKVEVKAVAKPSSHHPVKTMRLIVDGRPWKGVTEVRKFEEKPGEVEASWQIELAPGAHQLVVLADSAVSRGLSAPVEVTSSGEGLEQPSLYVLAMGISAYQGKMRLHYAAADSDAIAKVFQEKTTGLFKNVTVRQLKDEQATKRGMLEGLAWLRGVMTARDVAVVSFSGHGARDPLGNFYLVPVDVNVRDPRTLFEGDLLRDALANLPGKVVCLLDACHSGSVAEDGPVMKPGGADDLVRDLVNDEYGVIVMCSSLGEEVSLESSATKAGFFTLGIIEGMSGKADRNGDAIVYIHELDTYAALRVQQLSGGKQNPTTGRPPGIRTFPLAKP